MSGLIRQPLECYVSDDRRRVTIHDRCGVMHGEGLYKCCEFAAVLLWAFLLALLIEYNRSRDVRFARSTCFICSGTDPSRLAAKQPGTNGVRVRN